MGAPKKPAKDENRDRQLRITAEEKLARTPPGEAAGESAGNILHELQVHQIELEMQNEELKRAQVALEESRDKYLDLYDFAPVAYFTLTRAGHIAEVNLTGAALLGIGRPKLVGRGLGRFIMPDDLDRWDQHLVSVLQWAQKQTCELTLKRADGSTFHARLDSIRLYRPDEDAGVGRPGTLIRVAMSDISDLKRAEALRESEEKYRTLFQTMAQGVVYHGADGKIVSANPAAERILGLSLDQLREGASVGHSRLAIHEDGSDFPDETHPSVVALRAGKEVRDVVMGVFNPRNESYVWISVCAVPQFRPGESRPYQVYSTFDDITDRKRAEDALREVQERLALAASATQVGMFDWNLAKGKVLWTQTHEAIFGYAPATSTSTSTTTTTTAEHDSRRWTDRVHPDDLARVEGQMRICAREHRPFHEQYRIIWPDKSEHWIETKGVFFHAGDEAVRMVGIVMDITARKSLEAQLLQAQKMEAVGQLAGGIAHDFRNQLTVIKGYSEMLLRQESITDESRRFVEEIKKAADRSTRLTGALLAFSRKEMLRPEVINLNVVIADLSKSLVRMIGEDVRLSIAPAAGLGSVAVDSGQFQQALVNLVVNARDAMPKGGQLRIETANVDLDEQFLVTHIGAAAGPHVVVTVSDTGTGVDAETMRRIFDPFFTTKAVGQGTGLGLSMVHGFVRQSAGNITVESKVGHGTTFRIYLPRVVETAEPHPEGPDRMPQPRGQGTIMVVEDEESIRHLLTRTLTNCGYTVLAAADPEEAIPLASSHEGPIDLLLSDVVMPGMDGIDLAQHLRKSMPGLRVLFMSGYTDRVLDAHGFDGERMRLLVKPFSPQAVAEAVRKAMQAAG